MKKLLEIFDISEKDAMQIIKDIQEQMKTKYSRYQLLKYAKQKYKGNKLLFAISYIEFCSGFAIAIEVLMNKIFVISSEGRDEA